MSIRSLHITSGIGRESFGLGQVAVNLAKAQNDLKADARIWCLDVAEQIDWAIAQPGLARDKVRGFRHNGFSRLGYSFSMFSAVKSDGSDFDVVHQHGIWTACSHASNRFRDVHSIPTVIAPHGALQQWALMRSSWKKRLALLAYERKNLHQAACLHATAEAEVADFRDYGLSNPIALIPSGVSEGWLESQGNGLRFRERHVIRPDRRLLLFLSRITPKKGLPILLEAINRVQNEFNDWILVVAGTDEFGHLQEVKSLVAKLNLQNSVLFPGPLYGQEKRDAFAASDVFVLPSYSEGAPMVILDSLAAGVPVITTKASPWEDLSTYRCGWWVDVSVNEICEALKYAVSLPKEHLEKMGQRGKELVASKYAWSSLAQMTIDLYSWLLGRGKVPEFVFLNNFSNKQKKGFWN